MLRELFTNQRKSRKRHLMFPQPPQLSTSDAYANAITSKHHTIDNRMTSHYNKHLTTLHGNNVQSDGCIKSPDQIYEEYNTINNTTDVNSIDYDNNTKQLLYMKMDNKPLQNNYEITMKHISKPHSDVQQQQQEEEEEQLHMEHLSLNDNNNGSTMEQQHNPLSSFHNKPSRQQKRNKHQTSDTNSVKSGHSNRLNTLQQYISTIETNKTEKNNVIEQKMKQLNKLQMNVDLLHSKLKTLNKEHKSNMKSNRTMLKENDMFTYAGGRAYENSIYVNRNVIDYRKELASMKSQIDTLQNETNTYHNVYIQEDKVLVGLKDEVLKYHNMNNALIKGKESTQNEIMKYNNKINNLKSKINLIEKESAQFMLNVDLLVHESGK